MRETNKDWLPGFDKKFAELTHQMVKDLEKCLQCGKCTRQCPAAKLSSYNPREIIRDLRMGNVEKVISSRELWLCFFCSGCYAVCPRDINFPFAISMLRYAALAQGYGWEEVKKINEVVEMLNRAKTMEESAVKMYNGFANDCAQEGDRISMQLFESLAGDEERHFDNFGTQEDHVRKFGEQFLALQSIERSKGLAAGSEASE